MTDPKELFVPFNIGFLVKKKGFREQCNAFWHGDEEHFSYSTYRTHNDHPYEISAPLYQKVFEWLIKKGVVVRIDSKGVGYEVRAVEWDDFVWVDNKDSAIEKACELF